MQKTDRSVRSLRLLGGASTSRVLNLLAIGQAHGHEPGYSQSPLFNSPALNSSIVVKHRVRSDESYLFQGTRTTATKIILPFERGDLGLGGQSFFVNQRGFRELVLQAGNYSGKAAERDFTVLRLISTTPSLDPFLLREHLRSHDIHVDESYFQISEGDRRRMYEYTAQNIQALIELASGGGGHGSEEATSRLVSALLSNQVDEKLEPLRVTLGLAGEQFREGVFSWRGFLYYKWTMDNFWPGIAGVLKELRAATPGGPLAEGSREWIAASKRRIIEAVRNAGIEISRTLKIYDTAYGRLVEAHEPQAFRDFLLSAPRLFLQLGERLGAISHISSFWRYRFPNGPASRVDAEELVAMFQDFEASLGLQPELIQSTRVA